MNTEQINRREEEKGEESMPTASEKHCSHSRGLPPASCVTASTGRLALRAGRTVASFLTWVERPICRGAKGARVLLAWARGWLKGRGRSVVAEGVPAGQEATIQHERYPGEDIAVPEGHLESARSMPVLYLPQSELCAAAGVSALWPESEAGGECFGLQTRDGHIVVYLVTGPGPNAIQEAAYFRQDLEFFRRVSGVVWSAYAMQPGGFHHSHGSLGLSGPSGFDVKQVRRIATRNHLDRWSEIITSYADEGNRGGRNNRPADGPPWWRGCPRIRVRAFVYTDPERGIKSEACIRVIPGVSPFRTMALASGQLHPDDIAEYASGFPLEHVLFTSPDSHGGASPNTPAVFERLAEECRELPRELQNGIQFSEADGYVVVTLPMSCHKTVRVFYGDRPPYSVRAVFLHPLGAGGPQDVTGLVLQDGHDGTLNSIYEALLAKGTDGRRPCPPDAPGHASPSGGPRESTVSTKQFGRNGHAQPKTKRTHSL